jgi:branched-chain amino acid aminotransferase
MLPPLDQRDGIIWHNGIFTSMKEAKVHILTQSLHYASSVYEGCRIYNGKIFKLREHIERLFRSAAILKLEIKYSAEELVQAANDVVEQNNLISGYVRPLIWRGSKSLKIGVLDNITEVMIAAWQTIESSFHSQKPLELLVSKWVKPELNVMPAQCKSAGHYTMAIVSKYEAMELGFTDALVLDPQGYIAECTTSNIFFIKDQILYTPIAQYALDGITRQVVMKELDMQVEERGLTLDELENFDEAFVTGTAAEIQPVKSISYFLNNESQLKKIEFTKSEITEHVQKLYKDYVL